LLAINKGQGGNSDGGGVESKGRKGLKAEEVFEAVRQKIGGILQSQSESQSETRNRVLAAFKA